MSCARRGGFTVVELLVVVALIGILAALLLPVLAASKAKGRGLFCQNNNKQLATAWLMYADDHAQRLAYNLGGAAARTNINWAAGILDWELTADNTNLAGLAEAALGSYAAKVSTIYRCPSDWALSGLQSAAGWSSRARSYSMNASVGDAGEITSSGVNSNNPGYTQFFTLTSVSAPARIFVFLDEHPDSISDGYFVNRSYYPEWIRLPASWHNRAATFSFADGHTETHLWKCASTMPPPAPDAAGLPIDVLGRPARLQLGHHPHERAAGAIGPLRLLKVPSKKRLVPHRRQEIVLVVIGPTDRGGLVHTSRIPGARRRGLGDLAVGHKQPEIALIPGRKGAAGFETDHGNRAALPTENPAADDGDRPQSGRKRVVGGRIFRL